MHFLAIQASTVTVKPMLAEFFAVVRSDEYQCIFQQAPAIEFDHQLADLRVEVADAVIIGVAHQGRLAHGHVFLGSVIPISQQGESRPGSRPGARNADRSRRARYRENGRQSS